MRSNWRHVVFLQKMSVFISSSKSHGKRDVSQSVPWFAWRRLLSSMKAMGHPFLNQDWTPWEYSHNFSDLFIYLMYLLLCSQGCLHSRPVEVRRGHRSSWNWSYGWCYMGYVCGCWEPNLGPLQEQALLNTEPCLQEYSVLTIFSGIAEFESWWSEVRPEERTKHGEYQSLKITG